MRLRLAALAAAVVCTVMLAGCGAGSPGAAEAAREHPHDGAVPGDEGELPADESELSGDLTVFAAASLHGVFEDLAEEFTLQHPQARVRFSFAGSADLVAQLNAGAPADVLAAADESTMAAAIGAGSVQEEPRIFAANTLVLITPPDNPAGIGDVSDLAGTDVVVCAPHVPCGAATVELAQRLGFEVQPVSEEGSVADVLGKVSSGQARAGLVYRTDARAAGDAVRAVEIPGADDVVNRYPIAVASETSQSTLAQAWVDFVLGPQGRDALTEAGFRTP
ncbi:MAG TPA: molybdate ABC transporter substrate-binding protein [Beutenbergiaceae bacterium]|nr:molybdate ABC transporter substrate-binding protein [Beutenbergiaceae bacterium]